MNCTTILNSYAEPILFQMQHYRFAIKLFCLYYCLPHHQSITTNLLHPLKTENYFCAKCFCIMNENKRWKKTIFKSYLNIVLTLNIFTVCFHLFVSISLAVVPPFSIHSWQTLSSPKNTRIVHTYSCFSLENHPQVSLLLGFITFIVFNSTNNRSEIWKQSLIVIVFDIVFRFHKTRECS